MALNYASDLGLVDFYRRQVYLGDNLVTFNGVQFKLFAHLVLQRDTVVSYYDLLAQTDRGLKLGQDTAARRVSNGLRGASLALEAALPRAGDPDSGIIELHLGRGWSVSEEWSPPDLSTDPSQPLT